MKHGQFITIEGGEGAGKSTVLSFIQKTLADNGKQVLLTREPGGTPIAEDIRKLLLNAANLEVMQPQTELLLMFAARAQHIAQCILPALQSGQWVVSDRFVDASYAYQRSGRGIPLDMVQALDHLVVGDVYPGLTLLLDVPVAIGMKRAEGRGGEKDRIEQEKIDFFERVRQGYLDRAALAPERIKIIDATKSVAEVEIQVKTALMTFLEKN